MYLYSRRVINYWACVHTISDTHISDIIQYLCVYHIVTTEYGGEEVYGRSLEEEYAVSPTSGSKQL